MNCKRHTIPRTLMKTPKLNRIILMVSIMLFSTASFAQDFEERLKAAHGYGVFTYGMYAYSQGNKEQAFAGFTLATEEDLEIGRAFFHLGDILFERGNYTAAMASYRSALEIEPDYIYAYYNLACATAKTNENSKAIGFLEEAFQSGYDRFEKLRSDPDLAGLKDSPELLAVIERYRKMEWKQTVIVPKFLMATRVGKMEILNGLLESGGLHWGAVAKKAVLESDYDVRMLGFALYTHHGGDERIAILVRGLFDNNGYVNKFTSNALVEIGKPALPYLDAILASKYEAAKFYAKQVKELIEQQAAPAMSQDMPVSR